MRLWLNIITRTSTSQYFTKPKHNVAKSIIYFSKCTDIFTNLALEDWLYKNMDFSTNHNQLLMLWRNEPCVVIGRHQNPWLECNFAALPNIASGVKLARRNSGGGTVYHDMENLNLTFFSSREEYSRRKNLELISRNYGPLIIIHSDFGCCKKCLLAEKALAADQSRQMQDQMSGAAMAMPQDPKVAFKAEWEALEIVDHHWALVDIETKLIGDENLKTE